MWPEEDKRYRRHLHCDSPRLRSDTTTTHNPRVAPLFPTRSRLFPSFQK